jgi:hypothetical protein
MFGYERFVRLGVRLVPARSLERIALYRPFARLAYRCAMAGTHDGSTDQVVGHVSRLPTRLTSKKVIRPRYLTAVIADHRSSDHRPAPDPPPWRVVPSPRRWLDKTLLGVRNHDGMAGSQGKRATSLSQPSALDREAAHTFPRIGFGIASPRRVTWWRDARSPSHRGTARECASERERREEVAAMGFQRGHGITIIKVTAMTPQPVTATISLVRTEGHEVV